MNYPYYIAELREGRFKGQYPSPDIKHNPTMRNKWDAGQLGTGTSLQEFESEGIDDLLTQLKMNRINPAFDDVTFYMIRSHGSNREKINYQRLLEVMRRKDKEDRKAHSPQNSIQGAFKRTMRYAGNWYQVAKSISRK